MLGIADLISQSKSRATAGSATTSSSQGQDSLAQKMAEIEHKRLEGVTERTAQELGLGYQDLTEFPLAQEAISLVDELTARQKKIVCYYLSGTKARFGTPEFSPEAIETMQTISQEKHLEATLSLISQASYEKAIKAYELLPKLKKVSGGIEITARDLEAYSFSSYKDLDAMLQKANLSEIVTMIMAGALQTRTSDVHIEAEEKAIKIRYRIDGVLQTAAELKPELWKQVISRIKLLSHLKLNISSEPQDGRFALFLPHETVDLRVSTLPTAYGESVVMRILKSSAASLQFEQLGVVGKAKKDLDEQVARPNGMIITTGPTGSGKTTTLYAILNKLNDSETKIITLEDPVEYKLKGINQSQIEQPKTGLDAQAAKERYTFAKGLRAILRQDPDVVMVGEIRDLETAETAIDAALTGHLVISTIHTNSAAGAIPRFLAMGVQPFTLPPALNCVMGQRLVRRICQNCKQIDSSISNGDLDRAKEYLRTISPKSGTAIPDLNSLTFYRSPGCSECQNLGYKGRIGIYEILIMSKAIEEVVMSGKVSEAQMQDIAVSEGMVTMVQDGVLKALAGLTTLEEVFKVAE